MSNESTGLGWPEDDVSATPTVGERSGLGWPEGGAR
jgi:hypothetical protein